MVDSQPTDVTPSVWRRFVRSLLSKGVVRTAWLLNVAVLVATVVWLLRDGKFAEGAAAFNKHVSAIVGPGSPLTVVPPLLWPRIDGIWIVLVVGFLSVVLIISGLVAGSEGHRGIRAWLAAMILLAAWLTLFTQWPSIVWQGQAMRIRWSVAEFDALGQKLLADWPQNDGEIDNLGPFMAYPIGKPRTLMLVKTPLVPGTPFSLATIERGEVNDLYFQLAGNDEGVWVVRNPGDKEPKSFFSGLDGEYIPVRFKPLRDGWFMVNYIYAPTVLGDPGTTR